MAQAPNRVTDLPQARQFPGCKPSLHFPSFVALATKDTNMFKTQRNPKIFAVNVLPLWEMSYKKSKMIPQRQCVTCVKKRRIPLVGFGPSWCSESVSQWELNIVELLNVNCFPANTATPTRKPASICSGMTSRPRHATAERVDYLEKVPKGGFSSSVSSVP